MQLSSLDITLQRINMIENQFQSLMSYAQKPDEDFQKILNTSIENRNKPYVDSTSRAEINDLISINNAGSYAYTLTPILFSSHERPVEIYFKNINDYIVE